MCSQILWIFHPIRDYQRWFADDVTLREEFHTFHWDGDEQQTKTVQRENQMVHFKWIDDSGDALLNLKLRP